MNSFWQTPYRLGWMLLQALMQTARHADAVYVLFAIMLMNLFVGPSPQAFATNPGVALLWQLLSFTLMLTLMTGWMQVMHSRTWLFMVDAAKQNPAYIRSAEQHAPCLVAFATTTPEDATASDDSLNKPLPTQSGVPPFIAPLEDASEGVESLMEQALTEQRPVLMRPVRLPFFQGVGRFWGRSVLLNYLLGILLLGLMLVPFAYLAKFAGIPDTFQYISVEALEKLNALSNTQLQARLMALPRPELVLLSQWAAGLCASMALTLMGFLATALWWPTLIVWDVSPLQALGIQFQYLRRDYLRAIVVSSFQFGVLGFLIMLAFTRTGNLWVDAMTQVAVFFAYLYGVHLAYIYIYSVTRPEFLTHEQHATLQQTVDAIKADTV